jgi:glycosylphosphatidylinositol transamidase (GPIT) subunit GPI8
MSNFKDFEAVFKKSMEDFLETEVLGKVRKMYKETYQNYELSYIEEIEKDQLKRERTVTANKAFRKVEDKNEDTIR